MDQIKVEILKLGKQAKVASQVCAQLDSSQKNKILQAMAKGLQADQNDILIANQLDFANAKEAKLSSALIDRLELNSARIASMSEGLAQVAELPDPVGRNLKNIKHQNGLLIDKVAVPIGVIVMIYESRPNVTADAAGLCFKSGNAVILRGGKEAKHSNFAILESLLRSGTAVGLPEHAIQLVETGDHQAVSELVKLNNCVDLVIPRGGEKLISTVSEMATVPVIKHYKGVCHTYVDASADLEKASSIVINAKCSKPGVCNAMETLLVDRVIAEKFLPTALSVLAKNNVELRGEAESKKYFPELKLATEEDWSAEYLDLILAVKVVDGVDEAITHINHYGSHHSDAIIAEDKAVQDKFRKQVDSATVYINASTRFTDGFEFGMGAEIGISTDKLHARGPMGLEELTTYKYIIEGNGQVRK
jgi:glutamate-5-semialdehyde dehydrogenase